MSAPGAYRPLPPQQIWAGVERRSFEPLRQLSRSLDSYCVEAADPFEITAHLEALGYNDSEVLSAYGVYDHFELAKTLYALTPRRLALKKPMNRPRPELTKQLVMVFTLFVTASLGLVAEVGAWSPVFWLLVWSQLSAALLDRAHNELGTLGVRRTLSLLLELGLVGIAALWLVTQFSVATLTVSLLWLGVAVLLWGGRPLLAFAPPLAAGLGVILYRFTGLNFELVLVGTSFLTLATAASVLVPSSLGSWRWAWGNARSLIPFALYGLGQGCLLLTLLHSATGEAWPGIVLFATILFVSEWRLLHLHALLKRYVWESTDVERYAAKARRAVLGYAGFYLLPFLPVIALWLGTGVQPYLFYLAGFALFGLALALSLVALSTGDTTAPAAVFAAGGVLAVLGLPFFAIVGAMVVALLVALLRRCRHLGGYGVYLL